MELVTNSPKHKQILKQHNYTNTWLNVQSHMTFLKGTKNVKQMISLLAITGQFIPQNRCGAEWQETDVREYIRSADVISVFSIVLMV